MGKTYYVYTVFFTCMYSVYYGDFLVYFIRQFIIFYALNMGVYCLRLKEFLLLTHI